MFTTIITLILFLDVSVYKAEPQYETVPLRFDLVISRILNHQFIPAENSLEAISFDDLSSLLASADNVTQCGRDFQIFLNDALQGQLWALKTIDSWGKPLPSAILKGNGLWTGNYDECVKNYYQPQNKTYLKQPVNTQYCTLLPASSSAQKTQQTDITFGLCVPVSCNRSGVVSILHTVFKKSNVTEDRLLCSTEREAFSTGAVATFVILSLLGLLVLIGTLVDIIQNIRSSQAIESVLNTNGSVYASGYHGNLRHSLSISNADSHMSFRQLMGKSPKTLFIAEFSALKSLKRVFTIEKPKTENSLLVFLNGVRVLALFWVIIGHSIVFSLIFSTNPLDVLAWSHNIIFQLIINAVYSVDTFFVLSGFLTTVLFVRQVKSMGKCSFRFMSLYYIHRYIRLTPTFLLVIMISINLTPYFGHGPLYPIKQGFESVGCRNKSWWTSILYVSNLVQSDDMCLPISWYLHNDMQFHWIAPLALIPFVIGRKPLAFIVSLLMILTGIISILTIILYYPNLSLNAVEALAPQAGPSFFKYIYIKPWCRISAYAVGILTGFLVVNTGRTHRLNIYLKSFGTLLAVIVGLLCVFGTYPDYLGVPGLSRASLTAFQTLSRTAWSLSIAWLIFLCSTGQGGIVNKILCWQFWTPLARLNYAAYLIHSTILDISILNQTIPVYFQPHVAINSFVSNIFFSYAAAIVVHIFLETPFFHLEKLIFKRA